MIFKLLENHKAYLLKNHNAEGRDIHWHISSGPCEFFEQPKEYYDFDSQVLYETGLSNITVDAMFGSYALFEDAIISESDWQDQERLRFILEADWGGVVYDHLPIRLIDKFEGDHYDGRNIFIE